jgi:iron complex transport system ATP-binding protein
MSSNTAIKVKNLEANYGTHSLYQNFEFSFQYGQLYVILGNNGTGKSTFLRQLSGIDKVSKNKVFYNDSDLLNLSAQEKATKRFYIHAQSFSDKQISVESAILLALPQSKSFFGLISKEDLFQVQTSLNYFGIQSLAQKKLSNISDGEFQKVMLCMAFASQADIIVLDEPTAYLDFNAKKNAFQLLEKMCHEKNKCIVIATHDVYQIMNIKATILLIENTIISNINVQELQKKLNH